MYGVVMPRAVWCLRVSFWFFLLTCNFIVENKSFLYYLKGAVEGGSKRTGVLILSVCFFIIYKYPPGIVYSL